MINPDSKTSAVNQVIASLGRELEKPDDFFSKQLSIWLADQVLHGVHYKQVIVDVGYDVSAAAETSGESFDVDQYETVGDFLGELNGNTVATFCSGSGRWTETLEVDFLDEARELLSQWASSFNLSLNEWDEFYEEICDLEMDEQSLLDRLASKNLKSIVEQYRGQAENREVARQVETQRLWNEKQAVDQIAADAAASFFQANTNRDKFVMSQKSELLGLLNALQASLGEGGKRAVSALVHSNHLPLSNSLRTFLHGIYPLPSFED